MRTLVPIVLALALLCLPMGDSVLGQAASLAAAVLVIAIAFEVSAWSNARRDRRSDEPCCSAARACRGC